MACKLKGYNTGQMFPFRKHSLCLSRLCFKFHAIKKNPPPQQDSFIVSLSIAVAMSCREQKNGAVG